MKHYLLVFVLLSFFSKSQTYCNQTTFTATAGKTFTTSGNVMCCTLEKILVCAGTSSALPTVVADSLYNTMFHRVFLQTNTVFYLKNVNNFDTIFMKGLSIVNIKGTAPGTVTIVKEPSAIVINANINCTVNTFTCSSITSPTIGCGPASTISEINDNSNLISIYPNPANSNLTLNVSDYLFNDAEINLVNILGESVYQRKNITAKKVEIDLNNIPSGIYYIIVDSKEVKGVKKLIVTK